MSQRWWRAYDEAVDDPKIQRLPGELFKAWFNVLCIASRHDGMLPPVADVAFKLRMSEAKAEQVLKKLGDAGLIDIVEGGKLQPHNWNGRQFTSDVSTDRVKRFRERRRNVSSDVSATPPDTDTDTDTDKSSLRSQRAREWPSGYFDQFWSVYPNKVGKQDAIKALGVVAKSRKVEWPDLMAGLQRYIAKTDDRQWCNPATWIRGHRWLDQPAPPVPRDLSPRDQQQQRSDDAFRELQLFNRARNSNGREGHRLLPENSGERAEDFPGGDDRAFDELSGVGRVARR